MGGWHGGIGAGRVRCAAGPPGPWVWADANRVPVPARTLRPAGSWPTPAPLAHGGPAGTRLGTARDSGTARCGRARPMGLRAAATRARAAVRVGEAEAAWATGVDGHEPGGRRHAGRAKAIGLGWAGATRRGPRGMGSAASRTQPIRPAWAHPGRPARPGPPHDPHRLHPPDSPAARLSPPLAAQTRVRARPSPGPPSPAAGPGLRVAAARARGHGTCHMRVSVCWGDMCARTPRQSTAASLPPSAVPAGRAQAGVLCLTPPAGPGPYTTRLGRADSDPDGWAQGRPIPYGLCLLAAAPPRPLVQPQGPQQTLPPQSRKPPARPPRRVLPRDRHIPTVELTRPTRRSAAAPAANAAAVTVAAAVAASVAAAVRIPRQSSGGGGAGLRRRPGAPAAPSLSDSAAPRRHSSSHRTASDQPSRALETSHPLHEHRPNTLDRPSCRHTTASAGPAAAVISLRR